MLGYSADGATVFKRIEMLPAGAMLQFSRGGTDIARWQTPTYPQAHAGATEAQKVRVLEAIMSAVNAVSSPTSTRCPERSYAPCKKSDVRTLALEGRRALRSAGEADR